MSQLSIRIVKEIAFSSHTISIDPYIFRVDELLHKENKRAYEPEILAIGPYHRNKDHLKMMEGHKLRYIQEFLKRKNESSVCRCVEAMKQLEEKARYCYVDPVELDRDQFVKMMLFDGIFIMELLRNFRSSESRKKDILQSDRIQNILVRDILLFENQLPLFVLIHLSDVANEPNFSVEGAFWTYLYKQTSFIRSKQFKGPPTEVDFHHLLGVMRYGLRPSFLSDMPYVDFISYFLESIRCAMELQDAGIKFKLDLASDSLMDIGFKNGIMKISLFIINDDTEQLFRNLIAYEQYNHKNDWMCVTSYVKFMNWLIKSSNDVKIHRECAIFRIDEGMDDESTFSMFKKLSVALIVRDYSFCYFKYAMKLRSTANDVGTNGWPNGGIVGAYGWRN